MVERIERAVDVTIAAATVDVEAPAGERVRFLPEHLAEVSALCRTNPARNQVIDVTRTRMNAAVMALEPDASEAVEWHDALAALALLQHLENLENLEHFENEADTSS